MGRRDFDPALLRETFSYDPEIGCLMWLPRPWIKTARPAGTPSRKGYLRVFDKRFGNKAVHNVIWAMMTGGWPPKGFTVDHINGIRDDNRWSNLRLATPSQQNQNATVRSDSKSGLRGVSFHVSGKWQAKIVVAGKRRSLGLFHTKEEASEAYQKAARDGFGEFAKCA